jgi:UDP-sugar transporter A1/2/3
MPPSAARLQLARAVQAAQEAEAANADTVFGVKIKYVAVSALIVQHVASVMMLRYVRATEGEKDFSSQTAVIMTEAMKIVAATILTLATEGTLTAAYDNKMELLKMSVPALLYLLASNMEYLAAAELEAAVFTLLYVRMISPTPNVGLNLLSTQPTIEAYHGGNSFSRDPW